MKRNLLYFLLAVLTALTAQAQKLTVESMKAAPYDISASQYERKDFNGKACALVKVRMAATGTIFEGNVIQPVEHKTNEYWVYMTEGSKELHIKHPNYITHEVHFADYGINGLQSHTSYTLTVSLPQATLAQTQKLIINYAPANATVLIDSKLYKGNGRIEAILPIGTHQYIIAADGFASAEATVKLTAEAPRTVTEQLASVATGESQSQETITQQNVSTQIESQMVDTVNPLDILGATFSPLTDAQKKELSIKTGLQVTRVDSGKLKEAGIPQGFIILRVNDESIKYISDLQDTVKKASTSKEPVLYIMGIMPNGKKAYFAVDLYPK